MGNTQQKQNTKNNTAGILSNAVRAVGLLNRNLIHNNKGFSHHNWK